MSWNDARESVSRRKQSMPRTAEIMLIRLRMVMHMERGARTRASHKTSCDLKVAGKHKNARGQAASRLADALAHFYSCLDLAAK
jgi:hypothetical protein